MWSVLHIGIFINSAVICRAAKSITIMNINFK